MKRSPLPPRLAPMRRSALSRRPTRRKVAYEAELALKRPVVLSRGCWMCSEPATVVHHRKLRAQGGTNDWANLLPLCWWHHEAVHRQPAIAHSAGLIVLRNEDPRRVPILSLSALPTWARLRLTRPILDLRKYEAERVEENAAMGPEWGTA
jgi:hypothetical protein